MIFLVFPNGLSVKDNKNEKILLLFLKNLYIYKKSCTFAGFLIINDKIYIQL